VVAAARKTSKAAGTLLSGFAVISWASPVEAASAKVPANVIAVTKRIENLLLAKQ